MDLIDKLLWPAEKFARALFAAVRAEDFEYESTTSLPQPLGPTIYRQRYVPGTPARHQAQIIVVVNDEIVRDASDPEHVRTLVAAAAAEGFDELREQLRRRDSFSGFGRKHGSGVHQFQ